MFSVTSLGHQGWLIGSEQAHLLLDPVLAPTFARLPLTGATVFPPRIIDPRACPAIDAVLISHEHPDHLDFASLQRIDRRVPIYLSSHASHASRRIVESLGFDVRPLKPGFGSRIGDLEVFALAPDVIGQPGENEVDIVPLIVRNADGNFFTSVDIVQTPAMAHEVRRHIDRPGVWTYANNAMDLALYFEWMERPADPVARSAATVARRYVSLFDGWGHPEITLVNGDGAALGRDLARLNPYAFPVDSAALADALADLLPGHRFRAVVPGTTVSLRAGEIIAEEPKQPFLEVAPRTQWPPRGGEPAAAEQQPPFEPATGRRSLTDKERDELVPTLDSFAKFLFARPTYRGLYRLMAGRDHRHAVKPTLALVLRDGPAGESRVWEFDSSRCAFVPVDCVDPRARYVAGGEFWASDVLDVLAFRVLADDAFHFGHKRLWNEAPDVFRCDLDTEIQLFAHPLRVGDRVEPLLRACLDPNATIEFAAGSAEHVMDYAGQPVALRAPRVRAVPPSLMPTARHPSTAKTKAPAEDAITDALHEQLVATFGEQSDLDWQFVKAERLELGVRLLLRGAHGEITLEVRRFDPSKPHYRRVGSAAFSYGPSGLDAGQLQSIDRLIDRLAAVIAPIVTR